MMSGVRLGWFTIYLILLAAWASVEQTAAAQAPGTGGKKYAVLVGVENYEHASLREPPLKYASDDVTDLAQLLRSSGYEVLLLTDETGAADAQLSPTQANITLRIRQTLEKCRAPDTVMLAFAGHGLQFAGSPDAYFCPSDARPFPDRTDSLVSISGIYSDLERSFAGVKIIFVDACRNDPNPARGRGVDADTAPPPPRGVAALFSCSAGQRAFEHDDLRHGVFFHHVLQGLKGEAANRNGDITFQLLSNYVCTQVPGDVARLLANQRQFPNMKADLVGVPPILARVETPLNVTPAVPPSPPAGNSPAVEKPLSQIEQAKRRASSNLNKILIAMHGYEIEHKHFPAPVILGKDGKGKVPHSWRVEILPFLDEEAQEIYASYRFDEPWNGAHNKTLRMPAIFRSPLDDPDSTFTSCFALTPPLSPEGRPLVPGITTIFSDPAGLPLARISDGLSNTIMLVEAKNRIPWTMPADLVYERNKPLPALGGWFRPGFHTAMADGSVRFLSHENLENTIRLIIEPDDNQPIPELVLATLTDAEPPANLPGVQPRADQSVTEFLTAGQEHMAKQSVDQAITSYDQGLKLAPQSPELLLARGQAWHSKRLYDRELEDYRAALATAPARHDTQLRLAWFLATCPDNSRRDGKEALIHALGAAKLKPRDHATMDVLAAANAEVGDYNEALRQVRSSISQLHADAAVKGNPNLSQSDLMILQNYKQRELNYQQKQPARD